MKTIEQKRAELLALLKGETNVIELRMESVTSLTKRGTVDAPEYWVGSRKVEETEFEQHYEWVMNYSQSLTIDWSYGNKFDLRIYVSHAEPHS